MLYGIVWLCRWMIGPYKMLGRHQQLVLIVTAILSALVHSVTNGFTLDWTLTRPPFEWPRSDSDSSLGHEQ